MPSAPQDRDEQSVSHLLPDSTSTHPGIQPVSTTSDIEPETGTLDHHAAPSWHQLLQQADDMAVFIRHASEAAQAGDAEAAWIVFESTLTCGLVLSTLEAGDDAIGEYLAPTGITHQDEQRARDMQRCRTLQDDPVFADWRNPDSQALNPRYWRERALSLGSTLAKSNAVMLLLADLSNPRSGADREATIETVRGYIKDIVRSNDARALFPLGLRLMNGDVSRDWRHGVAMSLAACDMGYDCGADSPGTPWGNCKYFPDSCPPDSTFRSSLQESLSAADFARVDALAEQFKEAHRRGMYEELAPFMALDGVTFTRHGGSASAGGR